MKVFVGYSIRSIQLAGSEDYCGSEGLDALQVSCEYCAIQ